MATLQALNSAQHVAGIFADASVDGPYIGTLVIVVDRAKNLPNRKTIGKQDPYCAARLGKEAKKTNTDIRGGQTPRWDQELRFHVHDSPDYYKLKFSIFADNKKSELIGETWIDLKDIIVPGGGKNDGWELLQCQGKYSGEVRLEITYYDIRPKDQVSVPTPPAFANGRTAGIEDASSSSDSGTQSRRAPIRRRPLPSDPLAIESPSPSPTPASNATTTASIVPKLPPRGGGMNHFPPMAQPPQPSTGVQNGPRPLPSKQAGSTTSTMARLENSSTPTNRYQQTPSPHYQSATTSSSSPLYIQQQQQQQPPPQQQLQYQAPPPPPPPQQQQQQQQLQHVPGTQDHGGGPAYQQYRDFQNYASTSMVPSQNEYGARRAHPQDDAPPPPPPVHRLRAGMAGSSATPILQDVLTNEAHRNAPPQPQPPPPPPLYTNTPPHSAPPTVSTKSMIYVPPYVSDPSPGPEHPQQRILDQPSYQGEPMTMPSQSPSSSAHYQPRQPSYSTHSTVPLSSSPGVNHPYSNGNSSASQSRLLLHDSSPQASPGPLPDDELHMNAPSSETPSSLPSALVPGGRPVQMEDVPTSRNYENYSTNDARFQPPPRRATDSMATTASHHASPIYQSSPLQQQQQQQQQQQHPPSYANGDRPHSSYGNQTSQPNTGRYEYNPNWSPSYPPESFHSRSQGASPAGSPPKPDPSYNHDRRYPQPHHQRSYTDSYPPAPPPNNQGRDAQASYEYRQRGGSSPQPPAMGRKPVYASHMVNDTEPNYGGYDTSPGGSGPSTPRNYPPGRSPQGPFHQASSSTPPVHMPPPNHGNYPSGPAPTGERALMEEMQRIDLGPGRSRRRGGL